MALRDVYARARAYNDPAIAMADLKAWLSWARRCRPEPFKRLAATPGQRLAAVVGGMTHRRSNAYVEVMNGLLQQAKRPARRFRTARNFITVPCLRLSKLTHLPASPFVPAAVQ